MSNIKTILVSILCLFIALIIGLFTPSGIELGITAIAHPNADNVHEKSLLFLFIISFVSGIYAGKRIGQFNGDKFISMGMIMGFNTGYIISLGLIYIAKGSDTSFFAIFIWSAVFTVSHIVNITTRGHADQQPHPGRVTDR